MNRFYPQSPDPYIKVDGDQELAKFGHLNVLVDVFTSWASTATSLIATAAGLAISAAYNSFAVTPVGGVAVLPSLTLACQCKPCGPIPTIVVNNQGANALTVKAYVSVVSNITETVNGAASVSVPAGTVMNFVQTSCGTWEAYTG